MNNLKDALLEKLKKRSIEITKEDTAVPFPYELGHGSAVSLQINIAFDRSLKK
ncbi:MULTISPECIES: hypothetical protein [unclassified Microcoleus]|uniref:hypothetical protein n=1 Tax=unclassified Microcoleus TaxID=2642155 RepID=UPI002FD0B002